MVELELLMDGLESERWSVCVLGYRGHLQRQGPPGAMTLGHGVCGLCGLGQRNFFFLLSLGELFDFLKID